jgi:mono/diheme cytochrome c family protein
MRARRPIVVALLLAVAITAAFLIWQSRQTPRLVADSGSPGTVAAGRAVYAARCAACHGDRLQGQPGWRDELRAEHPPPPALDADGFAWHNPDRALVGIIRHGIVARGMPAFAGQVSDDDIWAVVAFMKSTWPEETRQHHDSLNPH